MLQGQPERRSRQGFPGSFSCPFWPFNWGIGRCWKHLISWTTSTSDTFLWFKLTVWIISYTCWSRRASKAVRIVQTSIHSQHCSTMMIYLQSSIPSIPKTSLRIDPAQCQEQIHPAGTFVWANGACYIGEFSQDNIHGTGEYRSAWVSSWVAGLDELTSGWSCCLIAALFVPSHLKLADARWSDGRHYHGQWSKNTLHGLGDMRLSGSCGSCEAKIHLP